MKKRTRHKKSINAVEKKKKKKEQQKEATPCSKLANNQLFTCGHSVYTMGLRENFNKDQFTQVIFANDPLVGCIKNITVAPSLGLHFVFIAQ